MQEIPGRAELMKQLALPEESRGRGWGECHLEPSRRPYPVQQIASDIFEARADVTDQELAGAVHLAQ
jgi:hypothetical protein